MDDKGQVIEAKDRVFLDITKANKTSQQFEGDDKVSRLITNAGSALKD